MVMISMLITIAIAFWFYRTAERLGSKALQWGIAGAIAYQVPAWAWMLLVTKPYISSLRGVSAKASASMFGHSWILVGLVTAFIIYKFFLLKTNVKADPEAPAE